MKVGDYVRTKNGLIFKIISGNVDNWDLDISFGMLETFEDNWLELYRYNDNGSFFDNKNIIKSSPNIIDLIEVGDYVNGSKVLDIVQTPKKAIYTEQETGGALLPIVNNRIESVLTKEQFESMQYKVKE